MPKTPSRPDQFDIGAVVQAPLEDNAWLQKCGVIGLLCLVPIVGSFNLIGWSKEITKRRVAGDTTLPDANLSYIGSGWRAFLSFLPLVVIALGSGGGGGAAVGALLGLAAGDVAQGAFFGGLIGMYLAMLAVATIGSVVKPAIDFLHIVDEEPFAGIAFRRLWEVMRDGGMHYFLLFVTVMLAGMVAQFGVLALFIGVFISVPYAQAVNGAALAEFERVLRPKKAGFDLVGSLGANSGSPFVVSI